jgi:hypothetical protein
LARDCDFCATQRALILRVCRKGEQCQPTLAAYIMSVIARAAAAGFHRAAIKLPPAEKAVVKFQISGLICNERLARH